eukprot:361935-Chlamydomonas_euryale.AAC.21
MPGTLQTDLLLTTVFATQLCTRRRGNDVWSEQDGSNVRASGRRPGSSTPHGCAQFYSPEFLNVEAAHTCQRYGQHCQGSGGA